MRRLGIAASVLGLLVFGACGNCNEGPGTGNPDGVTGDGAVDGVVLPDGRVVPGDGGATDGDNGNGGGGDECSGTQQKCDGECVSTRLNPDYCGDCQTSCGDNQVCNSGKCVSEDNCPYGMTACDGRCVDTDTNDDYCGDCETSCDSDKACGNGNCVDQIQVGDGPSNCSSGNTNVQVDFGETETKEVCSGSVAKTTFKWGICSCDNFGAGNNVLLDAFDSTKGPYKPGGYGGGLGSNGNLHVGKGEIWGAMWTSSTKGISSDVKLRVKQQMHSQGEVVFGTKGGVEGNAWIGDNVRAETPGPGMGMGGGETIKFDKTLNIPMGKNIGSRIKPNNVNRTGVNVSRVCNRCKKNPIPVKRIVKNHENNNDNSVIGLNKNALDQPGKQVVLKLPCGRYYLSDININTKVTIVATGNTALFVDGDIDAQSDFTIKPSPSGEFDVFVNGSVTLDNDLTIGSAAYPAYMRFYVNGPWEFMNNGDFGAYIYAVPGGMRAAMNNIVLYGGMYTQNYRSMNNIDVHYDREVLDVDTDCPDPDGGGGDAGMDADGGGGGTCTSKGDSCSTDDECCSDLLCENGTCGTTCKEAGEGCSTGECCSPLVCNNGTCESTGCKVVYESCSSNSECCSGICASSGGEQLCVSE